MVEIQSYKSRGLELATLSCVHFALSPQHPQVKCVNQNTLTTRYKSSEDPGISLIYTKSSQDKWFTSEAADPS